MDAAERLRLAGGAESEVVELARWVCLASRVEPHLLRRARLRFMARTNASLEADLWFGPLVQTRGARFIIFYPEVAARLREEMATSALRLARAWQMVRRGHRYLPELARLEEKLAWLALKGGPRSARQLDAQLRPLLKALLAGERKGLARWAVGALPRLPASAQTETARLVQMVAEAQLYGGWMRLLEPGDETGEPLSDEARALLFQGLERIEAGLRLFGDRLEVSEPPAADAQLIRVPATNPRLLNLSWPAPTGTTEARLTWPRPDPPQAGKSGEPPATNALLHAVAPPVSLTTIAGDNYRVVSQRAVTERMNEKAKSFLVTLLDHELRPVGTGLLIDEHHVVTTRRHIQQIESQALAVKSELPAEPMIRIQFPLLTDQRYLFAQVLYRAPARDLASNPDDLTLLELDGPALVEGAHPARLREAATLRGKTLMAFGSSLQEPDGRWAGFELQAADGYDALKPTANIEQSLGDWSGAPLIEAASGEVCGVFCLREKASAVLRPVPDDFLRGEPAPAVLPDIPRYFNPPLRIRDIGRRLFAETFSELMTQLGPQEALYGLYQQRVTGDWTEINRFGEMSTETYPKTFSHSFAAHIDSPTGFDELQPFAPIEYYAVAIERLQESGEPAAPKARIVNLPAERNAAFIGREYVLRQIAAGFNIADGSPGALQILYGLEGMGKTSLALEYAYHHADEYDLIWWIRAESGHTIEEDYISLSGRLDVPIDRAVTAFDIAVTVQRWLDKMPRWLLIFDGVPDEATIHPQYLPSIELGHVLITSRNSRWEISSGAQLITGLPAVEAAELLLKQTGETDEAGAEQLAEALGYLPLALDQAVMYMRGQGITINDYLDLLKTREWEMLSSGGRSTNDSALVATVWDASLRQIASASPQAAELLQLGAFLAGDEIPESLLQEGLEWPLETTREAPGRMAGALSVLREHSLVGATEDSISIHPLVQTVVRHRLGDEQARRLTDTALSTIDHLFPVDSDEMRAWPECLLLLPHARAVLAHNEAFNLPSALVPRLMNKVALYLLSRDEDGSAADLLQRATAYERDILRSADVRSAPLLNNLAVALMGQFELERAMPLLEQARSGYEEARGPGHPHVAAVLVNLGLVWLILQNYDAALELCQRALEADTKGYGPEHPTVAVTLINFGIIAYRLADMRSALQSTERALALLEQTHGQAHPDVAIGMNNLGLLYLDLDDRGRAEPLLRDALAYREGLLGADHPRTKQSRERMMRVKETIVNKAILAASLETRPRLIRIADAGLDISDLGTGRPPSA